jgi:Txe/YoeB family toxin of toxin-antitoxin system
LRPTWQSQRRLGLALRTLDPWVGLFKGIGKPEPLKYGVASARSRRITEEHRLVYQVSGEDLVVLQARYHYDR